MKLALKNVKKSFGIDDLLVDISFEVRDEDRIGIVGENGCGKTTLFKLIMGMDEPTSGVISKSVNNIGYLEQIPKYNEEMTVNEVIKLAFIKIYELEKGMRKLEVLMQNTENGVDKYLKEYSRLQNEYETLNGYNTNEKFARICTGLKFSEEFLNKKFSVLSGGEKTIVLLAKILLEDHDVLLLDEPTNHLDMESIKWLEEYLKEYRGAIVIISHDRFFLDRTVNKIVEIDEGKSTEFPGNYTYYVKEKEEKEIQLFEQYKSQQKIIKAMKQAIVRLKEYASVSKAPEKFCKRAKSIQKRLDKMEKIEKPKEKKNMKLNIQFANRSANNVLNVQNIYKKFEDKVIFEKASMNIYHKEKVALIGNNGAGKTTLINMLLGNESIDSGKIELGQNINLGYLEQQVKFENEDETLIEYFKDGYIITEEDARKYLAKFMFYGETVFKNLRSLSGGERSRARLAKMVYSNINFLILDEPTNHLDIDSIEVLEEALNEFKGTCFFISHDRYFINKIATKIVDLENKKLITYEGNYSYYLEKSKVLEEEKKEKAIKVVEEKKTKTKFRSLKDVQKDINKVQESLNKVEKEIENIEKEIEKNISDYVALEKLVLEKTKLDNKQNELMEKWYLLEEESNQIK